MDGVTIELTETTTVTTIEIAVISFMTTKGDLGREMIVVSI